MPYDGYYTNASRLDNYMYVFIDIIDIISQTYCERIYDPSDIRYDNQ